MTWWYPGRAGRADGLAAVIAADVILLAASAAAISFRGRDLELFGMLLACNAATVELTRRTREPEGHLKDVHAVWELPVVVLLPLPYALLMPLIRLALTQWRVRQAPLYRRTFSACAISVSYACASLACHRAARGVSHGPGFQAHRVTAWLVAVAACAVVQLMVNQGLVFAAVRATSPRTRMREFILGRQTLRTDLTETCMAVLSTLAIAVSPFTVVVALPLATLLQRSAVHGQLVKDARTDSKTGLLNAATWERGATAEIARAVRTRTPLAVALLDIDRFKVINDTYGHLTGGERVHVTVSIGVAALDAGSKREYAELMAAADAALYRAKGCGRDQVQMISTTRGLSAVSSIPRAAGHGPSLFRRASGCSAAPPPPARTRPRRRPLALCIFMRYDEYSSRG